MIFGKLFDRKKRADQGKEESKGTLPESGIKDRDEHNNSQTEFRQTSRENSFDVWVEQIRKMPDLQGQVLLWTQIFKLDKWLFAAREDKDTGRLKPFVANMEEKSWLFVFTDTMHASDFTKKQNLMNKEDKPNLVPLEPAKAIQWVCELGKQGIYGIRFNEGKFGWYAPISNLVPMVENLSNG